jgi:hypothetical protein
MKKLLNKLFFYNFNKVNFLFKILNKHGKGYIYKINLIKFRLLIAFIHLKTY